MVVAGKNGIVSASAFSGGGLSIEWSVDSLHIADGMVSAHGWYGSNARSFKNVSLLLAFADGSNEIVRLESGIHRPDVLSARPDLHLVTGFFSYRAYAKQEPPLSVSLDMEFSDGETVILPVRFDEESKSSHSAMRHGVFHHYAKRFAFHLFRGNWNLLWDRVRKHVPALFAKKVKEGALAQVLTEISESSVLIIDHALGGGANNFCDEMIQRYLQQSRSVVLWTFSPSSLGYQIKVFNADGDSRLYGVKVSAWSELAGNRKFTELVFNSCVSHPNPNLVPQMLKSFVAHGKVRLILLMHDFFMLCPSHFLLNMDGKYCGLPDRGVCRKCLPKIDDGLVSLYQARDIDLWRSVWGDVLEQADEVVCFSENTLKILRLAYPSMGGENIIVRPHNIDYLSGVYRYPINDKTLRVAMIGSINYHKGSEEFVELIQSAREQSVAIEFIVIGSLYATTKPPGVVETGPYDREELAGILSRHKVHIALMLSICPETFSYVTHELIKLKVPLFSFDLGAQGDAVRHYSLGRVAPLGKGGNLLPILTEFKKELDGRIK